MNKKTLLYPLLQPISKEDDIVFLFTEMHKLGFDWYGENININVINDIIIHNHKYKLWFTSRPYELTIRGYVGAPPHLEDYTLTNSVQHFILFNKNMLKVIKEEKKKKEDTVIHPMIKKIDDEVLAAMIKELDNMPPNI